MPRSHAQSPPVPNDRPSAEFASLRRRGAAMLYEALLLLGVVGFGVIAPQMALAAVLGYALPGWLVWLHMFVLLGVYFVLLWWLRGQTLAMQTWRLRVVDAASGRAPGPGRLLLRYLLAWPSLLLTLSGPGLIWVLLIDRDRQFLHDRLAGTCLVRTTPHAKA